MKRRANTIKTFTLRDPKTVEPQSPLHRRRPDPDLDANVDQICGVSVPPPPAPANPVLYVGLDVHTKVGQSRLLRWVKAKTALHKNLEMPFWNSETQRREKYSRGHDNNSLEFFEHEKILVARHNCLSLSSNGTTKDRQVFQIAQLYGCFQFCGQDEGGKQADFCRHFRCRSPSISEARFKMGTGQYFFQFGQQFLAG